MNQIPPIYRWRVYSSASKTKHFSWETSSALLRDHFLFFCGPTCAFLLRIYPFYFYLLPASNLQRSFRIWGVWDTKHFPHIVSSTMCLSRRCSRSWLANMPGSSALHPVGTRLWAGEWPPTGNKGFVFRCWALERVSNQKQRFHCDKHDKCCRPPTFLNTYFISIIPHRGFLPPLNQPKCFNICKPNLECEFSRSLFNRGVQRCDFAVEKINDVCCWGCQPHKSFRVFSERRADKKVHFAFNAWGFSEVIIPKGNFSDCNHTQ